MLKLRQRSLIFKQYAITGTLEDSNSNIYLTITRSLQAKAFVLCITLWCLIYCVTLESNLSNGYFTFIVHKCQVGAKRFFFVWANLVIRCSVYFFWASPQCHHRGLQTQCPIWRVVRQCSFICQGTSTRRQRSDLFGLRVKLPPVTTSLTTQR